MWQKIYVQQIFIQVRLNLQYDFIDYMRMLWWNVALISMYNRIMTI